MNYTYEIQIKKINKHDYSQPIVKESENNETPNLWSLSSLFNWQEINSPFKDSLVRTKKWLEKNHPEISNGFIISENGVYDRNNLTFWRFSELNISIAEDDSKISSFNRTKKWILENHPELLI
jgi:hypothetical protein